MYQKILKVKQMKPTTLSFIIVNILLISRVSAKPTSGLEDEINGSNSVADKVNGSNDNDNNIDVNENENKITDPDEDRLYREQYAKRMITYMNQSVDPCDDFYEYACGNWKNTLVERQSLHKRNNLLDIGFELADMVENLLLKPVESLKEKYSEEISMAQIFYQSCLSANLKSLPKSDEYLEVIRQIGGFPAIDETWKPDNFSWFNMSSHLSTYSNYAGLIYEEIVPEYPYPPYFKLPDIGFDLIVHSDNIATNASRGYQLNDKRMREYLTTYGVPEAKINETINAVFDLWYAILKVADEFDDDTDKCRELGSDYDVDEWPQWNNHFVISWNKKQFNESERNCPCPYYYSKMDEICSTRKEAVANYLAMKFLYVMDARLEDKKFQKEYCNLKVKSSLAYLIDKLYLAEYFHPEKRIEVASIMKELRKSFRDSLKEVDWLDEETLAQALLKESTIEPRIGSFESEEMMDRLIHEIRHLDFNESNFEHNNIEISKFKQYMKRYNGWHSDELSNTTKPLELLIGMQVNAFYYNIDNSINVMAGILHPPAFSPTWPYALKYGTLGYLIGHEITHGFDTVGAYFDSTGSEHYWWSEKSGDIFEERANCYVDKFDGYLIPEINRNINGNQTKDENIADNGGLRDALIAYHRFMNDRNDVEGEMATAAKDDRMPGLDLSPEQLFFLGFAQLWCSKYMEEHYWEELKNEHTMDKYRVLGTVSNMEEFSKAYNCSLGSKMNPTKDRCVLW